MGSYAERLERELNEMCVETYRSWEWTRYFEIPWTPPRARVVVAHMVYFTGNRRDCWGYVSGASPLDVKRVIWRHEQDELIHDARGDSDHTTLAIREAQALGLTREAIDGFQVVSGATAAFYAWLHLACRRPWLEGLAASHILERRNTGTVVPEYESLRMKQKLVHEAGVPEEALISTRVHTVADDDHTDMFREIFERHVTDEASYQAVLRGARESLVIDRALRAALVHALEALS